MDVHTKQRAVIKFFVHFGKEIPYVLAEFTKVYKNEALKLATVRKSYKWYHDNITISAEVVRKVSGRPRTSVTKTNVNTVRAVID